MTDHPNFFDDLEHALVAATADRARRLRRARARRVATMSTILVAVLAAGGGLAAALTTSDTTNNLAAPAHTTPAHQRTVALDPSTGGALPKPGTFTVAVLNGTTVPGLARGVANRLSNGKHKIGTLTNAASQDVAVTQILYVPGCRAAAQEVAHGLDVAPDSVAPATAGARVLAGDRAQVIVIAGADQDTSPHP
jgi:LytR cell envelope-related transcriptional attenuator